MAIREGQWRCPYCSTANRGRELACAACGATRDANVELLEQEAPEVVEQTLIPQARAGADWLCAFCRSYRDKLSYEIERWVPDRTERAEGNTVLLRGRKIYLMELAKDRWSELRDGEAGTAVIRGSGRVMSLR